MSVQWQRAEAAGGSRKMDKNREDEQRSSDSITLDGMDLLSLTVRSLDLTCSMPQQVLNLDRGDVIEISRQGKEEARTSAKEESKELRSINLDEVAWHDTEDSCWIVIHDFVYDCTNFFKKHPGSAEVILEYAGRDATLAFAGTGHSSAARQILKKYLIGELPPEERIFRVPNGVRVSGV